MGEEMPIFNRVHRQGWRSPLFLLPAATLFLFTLFTLWTPAKHRLPGLSSLPKFGVTISNDWNRKGGKAGRFASDARTTEWGSKMAAQWWTAYSQIILDGKPNFDEIRFATGFEGPKTPKTYLTTTRWDSREQRLTMNDEELVEMADKHIKTLSKIEKLAPQMPYVPGTRGIVLTTAVDAMAFLTVSLRMLRRTGTTLPVEIWMYDRKQWMVDPWALRMCEEIWAPLGATCHFVADHISEVRPPPWDKPTQKYMNKFDAMMFSSFEQILFLDSDNNAVLPLDDLFDTQPFTTHGLVLWPDYWRDWASPYFFQIAGIPETSIFDRASTESGQVMVNKRTHATALLMAAYYGRYQSHYVRLLEQEPGGEGDKECFLRAALASNLSVYQVAQPPDRLGYRCDGGERPVASAQHHPEDDYYLHELQINRGHASDILNDGTKPRIMFIHGNLPKYDPAAYLHWHDWNDQLRCNAGYGKAHRIWGTQALSLLKHGWDVEKALWDQMLWTSCETEYLQAQWWTEVWQRNWTKLEHICEDFTMFYKEVLGPEGLEYSSALGPAPYDRNGEYVLRANNLKGSIWDDMLLSWRSKG